MPSRLFGDDVWDLSKKLKRFKPVSPGIRHLVRIDRSELWRGRPVAALTKGLPKKSGRSRGRIAVRHRGGGHKRNYRFIDFKRNAYDQEGVVQRLEYDPNRSTYIALVRYPDESLSYILAPQDIRPGDTVQASRTQSLDIKPGNALPLGYIPIGTHIHNLEMRPGKGGQVARSAGGSCTIQSKNSKPGYALVRLASKELRMFDLNCMATIGQLSNPLHKLRQIGKAGYARHMGKRPRVRGVAMNPVDHPMGGGEGKSSGGRCSVSKWGQLSKGYKTRGKRSKNNPLIIKHRPDSRERHMFGRT
jgi:large subunit ribosomal protein L2